ASADPAWKAPHAAAYAIYRGLFEARNEAAEAGRRLAASLAPATEPA
ncbi:MAG: hypothetical protein JO048_02390, partial [Methylobacteriaceae bacterium]|nr:hypothetical protein [Methylobacteriaceae bacterium]